MTNEVEELQFSVKKVCTCHVTYVFTHSVDLQCVPQEGRPTSVCYNVSVCDT